MIDISEIKRQAERRYEEYLASLIDNTSFFPLDIRFGKVKSGEAVSRYEKLKNELRTLKENSDENGKISYHIDWEERQDRLAGNQRFPARIYFPDERSFLTFLGKKTEAARFKKDADTILASLPQVKEWVQKKPRRVVEHTGDWEGILAVTDWIQKHPRPNLYLREIPAVEDTKFIERKKTVLRELLDIVLDAKDIKPDSSQFEERYGFKKNETLLRVKILDTSIAETHLSGISDVSIPVSNLENLMYPELSTIIIAENKTNFANIDVFLTIPRHQGSMAIFGSGFAVGTLRSLKYLESKRILYWGDIDTQGLRILALLRRGLPHCQAIMMDRETFDTFPQYHSNAPEDINPAPAELTESEKALYQHLATLKNGNRLEQERIPLYWVRQKLEQS